MTAANPVVSIIIAVAGLAIEIVKYYDSRKRLGT